MLGLLWFGLMGVGICLIVLGIARPSESAQALVGFTFLFLLAFPLLNSEIDFKNGTLTNTTYTYNINNSVTLTEEVAVDTYSSHGSRNMGFYLAVVSLIGFVMTLVSLRGPKNWQEGR